MLPSTKVQNLISKHSELERELSSGKVDKKNYYDWENTVKIVRELQPDAVIFSDAGPDIRWVGNEKGYANQTTWSPILKDSLYPGMLNFNKFSAENLLKFNIPGYKLSFKIGDQVV